MKSLNRISHWLGDEPHQLIGVRVLQTVMGLVILFRLGTETPFANYLWGPHSLGRGSSSVVFGASAGRLLDLLFASNAGLAVLCCMLLAGALGLVLGYSTRAATALALLGTWLLELRLPELCDGGDNILRLALCYMLFVAPAGKPLKRGSTTVWLHNLAVCAIGAQVIVVYLTSGFMKAQGGRWFHGTALYLISQVEWFSLPAARGFFKNPLVTTFACYSTVLYQVWFPLAIFSPVRRVWLLAGFSFHFGIAVFMGLITFSSMMCAMELFLVTDDEYRALFQKLRAVRDRLAAAMRRREPRFILYIDGFCATCLATAQLIRRLDWTRSVDVRSFRHDDGFGRHGIELAALERRMHMVDGPRERVVSGFAAVQMLTRALPLAWPARPLLAVVGWVGLGDRVYDALALRRRIVPDARACSTGACEAPRDAEERAA